jgi:glycosyltransferase involved in cell wall biosynthesis
MTKKGERKTTTKDNPMVSVLIPVYNGIPYIIETLESILKSTYNNFEIILVDDGSKDSSKNTCRAFERKFPRIRFFSFEDNQGMDAALNLGIKNAKGKYIARINQDDIMMPDRLEKQVKFLEENPDHTAVGGQINLFTNDNPEFDKISFLLTDEEIKSKWMMFSPYADPTVMYRKDAVLKTPGYNEFFWPADDVHMWYMLGSIGKLANLPDVVTRVRWHAGAGSIQSHKRQIIKTWSVHQWAAEHIEKPSLKVKLFWACEYIAGLTFPPKFNWFVYRRLKNLPRYKNAVVKVFGKIREVLNMPVKDLAYSK